MVEVWLFCGGRLSKCVVKSNVVGGVERGKVEAGYGWLNTMEYVNSIQKGSNVVRRWKMVLAVCLNMLPATPTLNH